MGVYVSKVGGNIKILIIVVCVYKYIRKQNHMFYINVILMFPHIPRARGIYHSFHSHVESSLCTYNLTTLYSDWNHFEYFFPVLLGNPRCRDRMVGGFIATYTNVVRSNPTQARCTRYIMWYSLSVTCDRSADFYRVLGSRPPVKLTAMI